MASVLLRLIYFSEKYSFRDKITEIPKNRLCIDSCLQLCEERDGAAAAIVRSCSLLLSRMMASRPSCRDLSLIRWDSVFLFVQSTHHFTVHDHKQTGGILLGERKQQNFVRLRRKQERPSARMASLKAQDRAKVRRSETVEAAPSAEQTQTADQEEQEQANKEDQGREEEKVHII